MGSGQNEQCWGSNFGQKKTREGIERGQTSVKKDKGGYRGVKPRSKKTREGTEGSNLGQKQSSTKTSFQLDADGEFVLESPFKKTRCSTSGNALALSRREFQTNNLKSDSR